MLPECNAQREKYWSEADADLKAERCREAIYRLISRVDDLEKQVRDLLAHEHSQNGKLVRPITSGCGSESNFWKVLREKERVF